MKYEKDEYVRYFSLELKQWFPALVIDPITNFEGCMRVKCLNTHRIGLAQYVNVQKAEHYKHAKLVKLLYV